MMHLTTQTTQPAANVAKQSQQPNHHNVTTTQMYHNYMQTGSIYYNINGKQHPPYKIIATSKNPASLKSIQKSAKEWVEKIEKRQQ